MELIDVILSKGNLNRAYKKVVANKGASGVDGVTVEELGDYISLCNGDVANGRTINKFEYASYCRNDNICRHQLGKNQANGNERTHGQK